MIVIVDYDVGNLASIKNILKRINVEAIVASDKLTIERSDKLILPGVGAYDTCAGKLNQSGLRDVINKRATDDKVPTLGICVGMQLMLEGSEEGSLPGLGWIKGKNIKFRQEQLLDGLKVPHMGWTDVSVLKPTQLFENMPEEPPRFYFVHSYHPQLANQADAMLSATYGYNFVAGIERENILGVQFHPEKSHSFGMKLFENFVKNY